MNMKKSLLALSVLGLAAGAACAQSSVTMFGIVDVNLSRGTGSVSDKTQFLRGGLNSNRLGFRGTEDLGGGMSASFWLEAGMDTDDGEGQPTNSNNQASGTGAAVAGRQGLTFARRSTVSLAGNWGEIRLGRDYTPQYWNLVNGDPFGNVGVGASIHYTAIITGPTNTRASNSASYFTPNTLGGFGVQVTHYLGENNSGAATSKDGTGTGIRGTYDSGPLGAGIGWGRTKYAAGDTEQRNAYLSWKFAMAKVMGVYVSDSNGTVDARGGTVGVIVPVGVGEIKGAYSRYRFSTVGEPTAIKLAVGYVHNLSKRTAVYTTFARVKNSGGSALALNGAVTGANASSSGFDLGLRHSF
ncbi:MAG: porin [Pseudomonadota bacterium]